jgi:hypothetical protein
VDLLNKPDSEAEQICGIASQMQDSAIVGPRPTSTTSRIGFSERFGARSSSLSFAICR